MSALKIKYNALKIGFFLFLVLWANSGFCQQFPVAEPPGNKNVKLTIKVITIKSRHFIIPNLKVLSDTQNIQVHRDITYASERLSTDAHFYLGKIIKKKLVYMYVDRLYHTYAGNELIKFTTKDSLTDTICIEDFIPLEPGQYRVSLAFSYFLNGVIDTAYSDDADFLVTSPKPPGSAPIKRTKKKK